MKHLLLVLVLGWGVGAVDAQTVDPCRADIDRSGEVDFRDFQLLVDAYGTSKCGLYWLGEDLRLTIWDTLIVRDTIVVRDTLVVRETVRDTVLVIEREQPGPGPSPPGSEPPPQPPLPAPPSNTTTTDQPQPEQPQPEQPQPEQPQPEQPQPEQQWPGVSLVCSSETRAVFEVYDNLFREHVPEDFHRGTGTLYSFNASSLHLDSIRVTEETAVADFDNDGFFIRGRGFNSPRSDRSDYWQYLMSLRSIVMADPDFEEGYHSHFLLRVMTLRKGYSHSPGQLFDAVFFELGDYHVAPGRSRRYINHPPTYLLDGFCAESDRYMGD